MGGHTYAREVGSRLLAVVLVMVGCGERPRPAPAAELEGGVVGVLDGRTVRLALDAAQIRTMEVVEQDRPGVLWPSIVDSHVHVTYWPVADQLAASGIATVVDLAAPERALDGAAPIRVIAAGPMLTRPEGYPLESWGADGYGAACADAACIATTIDRHAKRGARLVKIAMGGGGLDPALVPVAIEHAHARRLKVAVHALDDASARQAGLAGADVLAHTPVERLAEATIEAWRDKAVISTLAAFGAPAAIDNLRRLRAAGTTVLYGTDLGNLRDAGPSRDEIALLREAGLDDAAIVAAMTTTPARYWRLPAIEPGGEASFLLLERDPRTDVRWLLEPRGIWLRGRRMR